jgi:hypothetical protein
MSERRYPCTGLRERHQRPLQDDTIDAVSREVRAFPAMCYMRERELRALQNGTLTRATRISQAQYQRVERGAKVVAFT